MPGNQYRLSKTAYQCAYEEGQKPVFSMYYLKYLLPLMILTSQSHQRSASDADSASDSDSQSAAGAVRYQFGGFHILPLHILTGI